MAVRLVVRRSAYAAGAEGDIARAQGPDSVTSAAHEAWTYEFEQARIVLGRSPGADVRLPDLGVSEHHATLEHSGAGYALRDENSTNGTRVGTTDLVAARPRLLSPGDLIEIGPFLLEFELGSVRGGVTPPERTASLARKMLRDLLGPSHPASLPPRVYVQEGPDEGLSVRLAEAPAALVIGRAEDAGLTLSDVDASRSHVEITRDADGATARDLGSKNGLIVNGKVMRERRLKHGDSLTIGRNLLVYEDPAEQAIKALDGQPDLTITRTRKAHVSEAVLQASTSESKEREPAVAQPDAPRSSMDTAVYVMSAALLLASVAGLIWLFA